MSFTPLDPTEFKLVGFPPSDVTKKERIVSCGILNTPPAVETLHDALYLPARYTGPDQRHLSGGIVHGQRHLGLRRRGRTEYAQPEPVEGEPEILAEPVVWLGWLFNHFGHFLLESLSRMWALEGRAERVLFHLPEEIAPNSWRLLELMGVPRDRILVPERPTSIRTLLCPSPAIELQWAAHPRFIEPFQRLAEEIAGEERPLEQPLYLSRSRLKAHKRRIQGEAEFEAVLERRGFRVFHPQHHPLEEQIRVVNRHRHIVASNGSAAHLILFCLNQPKHTLLTHVPVSQDFFLCSKLAGVPTTVVYCLHHPDKESNRILRIDRDAALKYLDDRGFRTRALDWCSAQALAMRRWVRSRVSRPSVDN